MQMKLSPEAWKDIIDTIHRVEVLPNIETDEDFYKALSDEWICNPSQITNIEHTVQMRLTNVPISDDMLHSMHVFKECEDLMNQIDSVKLNGMARHLDAQIMNSIPDNEIHCVKDGKTVGKIINVQEGNA